MRRSTRGRRQPERGMPFLIFTLLATSGVYVALVSVGGLTVRLFEISALAWLALALPRLVIPVDWVLGALYAILASIVLSVLVHGFEASGVLLLFRMSVAFALALVVFVGLPQREGGVRSGVVAWALGGGGVVLIGVITWRFLV